MIIATLQRQPKAACDLKGAALFPSDLQLLSADGFTTSPIKKKEIVLDAIEATTPHAKETTLTLCSYVTRLCPLFTYKRAYFHCR